MFELDLKAQIHGLIAVQNYADAYDLCIRLCEQCPNDAEAHFLLGSICGQTGDYAASESALLKAFSQAPNHPQLNYNLAVALFEQGKFEQAVNYAARVVQLEPGNYHGWLYLGQACQAAEQLDHAEKSYVEAIKVQPTVDNAYRKLGELYVLKQTWLSAADVFVKLLEMGYSDDAVINGIGTALARSYKYDRLINVLEPLALEHPENVVLNYRVAMAYMELADLETASKYFNVVLTADPEHAESVAGLAGVYKFMGDYGKAIEILSPFISTVPNNPGVLLVFAAIAHKCDRVEEAIGLLHDLLENEELADVTEAKALVSLGALYEKQGDYVKSFQYVQQGNQIYSPGFDREGHIKSIEVLEQIYALDNINLLPVSGSTKKTPIFILGMPRSGTSLVEQILASHSNVYGGGELKYIQDLVIELHTQQVNNKSYPYSVTDVSPSELMRMSESYLDKLELLSAGSARVTDKMPANFTHIGLIYQLFPDAKILHCVRDPMDTCVSCYSKFFSGAYTYSYDMADLGFYYRSYERLMKLWKYNLPIQIFDVSYEELVNNQEKVIKDILEYCELPWEPECMSFYNTARTVATASTDQVRKPMYKSSIGKWRRYEQFVTPLIEALEEFK